MKTPTEKQREIYRKITLTMDQRRYLGESLIQPPNKAFSAKHQKATHALMPRLLNALCGEANIRAWKKLPREHFAASSSYLYIRNKNGDSAQVHLKEEATRLPPGVAHGHRLVLEDEALWGEFKALSDEKALFQDNRNKFSGKLEAILKTCRNLDAAVLAVPELFDTLGDKGLLSICPPRVSSSGALVSTELAALYQGLRDASLVGNNAHS